MFCELLLGGFQGRGVAQSALFRVIQLFQLRGYFFLAVSQIAGTGAEMAQFFRKSTAAFFPQILPHFLKLPLGSCAGGKGLGHVPLGCGLGGVLNIFPGLLQGLFFLSEGLLVFRFFHPLVQFIDICQHLALLILQALQFAL